jgi:hypothetical protein
MLKNPLGVFVVILADAMVANVLVGVDEVQGRPVVVVEGAPDPIVVVDRDLIVNVQVGGGAADVVEVVLEVELGRVHADDHQAVVLVLLGPGADVREGPEPVDAGVGPELDQDDLAAQLGCRRWRRIEPSGRPAKKGQPTSEGWLHRCERHQRHHAVGLGQHRKHQAAVLGERSHRPDGLVERGAHALGRVHGHALLSG